MELDRMHSVLFVRRQLILVDVVIHHFAKVPFEILTIMQFKHFCVSWIGTFLSLQNPLVQRLLK